MILYKYFCPDRLDVLRNALIRFTQPGALNDPFDCSPRYLRPEELAYAPEGDCAGCVLSYVQGLQLALSSHDRQSVGLVCLTEKPDNLLMWAHYAQSHQGFVVGFDTTHAFFAKSEDGTGLWKVQYRDTRPSLPKETVELELLRQPKFNPEGIQIALVGDDMFSPETSTEDYRFVKSIDWQYEQEWRLLRRLHQPSRVIQSDTELPICLFEFPRAIVHSVIVGFRNFSVLYPQVQEILAASPEYRNVNLLKTRKDADTFHVPIVPADDVRGTFRVFMKDFPVSVDEENEAVAHTHDANVARHHEDYSAAPKEDNPDDEDSQKRIASVLSLFSEAVVTWWPRRKLRQFLGVKRELQKCLADNREDSKVYDQAAFFLRIVGKFDQAVKAFEASLKCDPMQAEVWYSLGHLQSFQKNYSAAETAYRTALKIRPNYATARTNLGICLFLQGHNSEAEECYRAAIRDDPNLFEPRVNLASLLIKLERYEEALTDLVAGIHLQGRDATPAFRCVGQLLRCLASDPLKKQELLQSLLNDLQEHRTLGAVVLTLRADGFNEEVIPFLQKQARLRPNAAQPHLDLASVLRTMGKIDQSDAELSEARRHISRKDWYALGSVAAISSDPEGAFTLLQRLKSRGQRIRVRNDPNFSPLRNDPRFSRYADL